jgi:AcrR family transcriptional regulator
VSVEEKSRDGLQNESRSRIIQEARRLFIDRGYDGISMREIAEASGVSKAGIYYHFKDKEALFLTILGENLARMAQLIADCQAQGRSCQQRISCFVREVFRWPPGERAVIRLAVTEMPRLGEKARHEFGLIYREKFIDPLTAILRQGVDSGELRAIDPHRAVWLLLGAMYPFFHPPETTRAGADDEETAGEVLQIFFEGVLARRR